MNPLLLILMSTGSMQEPSVTVVLIKLCGHLVNVLLGYSATLCA